MITTTNSNNKKYNLFIHSYDLMGRLRVIFSREVLKSGSLYVYAYIVMLLFLKFCFCF